MKQLEIFLCLALLLNANTLPAQDTLKNSDVYPNGISLKYGFGKYSVKDQYISDEKYSGNMPEYGIAWARKHNKYVYKLEAAVRLSQEITNYNVSTNITQVNFSHGFLYPLKKLSLFNKDLFIWLGPSTEFFFYVNEPRISVDGFDYAQSFAGLFSIGFNTEAIYPLSRTIFLETSLDLTPLSVGIHIVDSEEEDRSPVKPVTLLSGLNSSFNLGFRYFLLKKLSFRVGYKFEFTKISAWDPLLSASDNIVIGLTYGF
jgi:hypothetical protein